MTSPAAVATRPSRGTAEGFTLTAAPLPLSTLVVDLWHSRRLIAVLARKDFFVRYRRASFGMLWAVGLPLFQAFVMALVFSRAVHLRVPHFPVFVFSGLLGWTFFSGTVTSSSTAIVDGAGMASRIYFPRAGLPLITLVANTYGFVISLVILLVVSVGYGVYPGLHTLYLLPAAALMLLLTASMSLFLSAAHVYFRDVRYLLQAITTAWFYVTPVLYPMDFAPGTLRKVLEVNPVTGVIELFRAATVGADPGWLTSLAACGIWTAVFSVLAVILHRRYDRLFADLM